jgi:hypothetical protein
MALALGLVAGLLNGCAEYVDMMPPPSPPPAPAPAPAALALAVPHVVWLNYADGTTPVPSGALFQGDVPFSAGDCDRACRDSLLGSLDARFSGLDLAFTEALPAGPHYTVMLNSGGNAWQGENRPNVGGEAPFLCDGTPGATAFVYLAGDVDADTLVVIAAHEIGHMFGLEHTADGPSTSTIMNTDANPRGQAFGVDATVDDACNRPIQDEPAILAAALGGSR